MTPRRSPVPFLMIGAGAAAAVACALALPTTAPAQPGKVLMGTAAYGDYTNDAPGVRRHITAADLPAPGPSQAKSSKVVPIPAGAMPKVPAGFDVKVYTTELKGPRVMKVAPNGDLFITETNSGRIRVIRPGGDKPASMEVFAEGLPQPSGIAFYPAVNPQWVYIGETEHVVRFPYHAGDMKARGPAETIAPLSPGGHFTRDLVFSRDGKQLLVGVGSATNYGENRATKTVAEAQAWDKQEGALGVSWGADAERANVLSFSPDGKNKRIYATGIRNCVGLATNPTTGDVYCAVNERDALGDNLVPDYVTRVKDGGYYGWPWWYTGNHEEPRLAGQRPDLAGKAIVPDVLFQSHSAAVQVVFNTSKAFPADMRGDAFVVLHGSWNHSTSTGYKVVRVPIRNGVPTGEYDDFMTGFVADNGQVWGRPAGLVMLPDGSMLIADDANSVVYRVTYKGR